jgi:ubiquinone/menaquinone biosynthesis C-methylase UbiE
LKEKPVAVWKEKRKIMQRYDLTAEMYEARYAEEQEAKYKAALESVKVSLDSVVLDAGCGSGLLFKHLAQAKLIVGVDISRNLLLQAKQRALGLNAGLIVADADHLPFQDKVFSVVFAFTVLQNMPKPQETLVELKRVSKVDASFVLTALRKAFSLDSFLDVLEVAGLRVVSFMDDEVLKCYIAIALQS